MGVGAGRAGGIVTPLLRAAIMRTRTTGRAEALAVVALALVVAVGIMLVFGEETARRGLEDIAELAAAPRVS